MRASDGPVVRVRVKKPAVVKPPAGDIASSGGDYGTKRAAPTVKRTLKAIRVAQAQVKDTKSAADLGRAHRFLRAHPEVLHPPKPHKGGFFGEAVLNSAMTAVPGLAGAAAISDKTLGTHILPGAEKAVKNAPGDAAELAVSTPSSLVKVGDTAIHHPTKLPGLLAAPYEEVLKHPGKAVTEHPVSTLLMFAPSVRVPGLAAGRLARIAKMQDLERPAAVLPRTPLKEARVGSRDLVVRAAQKRKDVKNPATTMTVRQVQKRVDEAYGAEQKHRDRIEAAIARKTKAEAKALPKDQRPAFVAEQADVAKGAAKAQAQREFAKEFGATAYHNEQGALMKPKHATQGVLHDTREQAQAVADALNRKPLTLAHGGFTKAEKLLPLARTPQQVKFVVSQAGDKHAVLPDFVAERLTKQRAVGTSMAPGAKLLRVSRGAFTRAVLPYRPTWLSGQGIEGALRAAIHGAGPTSYLRAIKVGKEMERINPGSYGALRDRAVPAGKIGKVMREFAGERKTLVDEFPNNPLAHALTSLGQVPGIKQVRAVHHAVSGVVFRHINAQFLEQFPQTVMLGRALKKSPLMDHHLIGLSDKAIHEAAQGLQNTETMNLLARDVQRAYGKYSNFGPALREAIVHWTPFVPWTLNAVRFLATVLPKDHPVLSSLIASADAAEEDWRKAHRLSLHASHLPFFDLGGYPTHGGKDVLRVGHYTPFGAAVDPSGGLSDMVLPQFSGMYGAVKYGLDWKGQPLRHPNGKAFNPAEQWLYGLTQLAEAMVPLAQQTQDVATSKHPARQVQKELRVLSTTRIKPPKTKTPGGPWDAPSTSGGSGWDTPKSSTAGGGWG
jgi:hypothetical protein